MSALIWVHEDALRDNHPVRAAAGERSQAVFIGDDAYFRAQGYSAKRLIFITECLADMNIDVFKGDTQDMLMSLADKRAIYTASTPNPVFRRIIDTLDITAVDDIPLARIDEHEDLGRFFRYWKKAGESVMNRDGWPNGQEDMFT